MVIDRVSSEEICNECAVQTIFCQSHAFLTEKSQILSGFFYFQKKPQVFKKTHNLNSGFIKAKLATLT